MFFFYLHEVIMFFNCFGLIEKIKDNGLTDIRFTQTKNYVNQIKFINLNHTGPMDV